MVWDIVVCILLLTVAVIFIIFSRSIKNVKSSINIFSEYTYAELMIQLNSPVDDIGQDIEIIKQLFYRGIVKIHKLINSGGDYDDIAQKQKFYDLLNKDSIQKLNQLKGNKEI